MSQPNKNNPLENPDIRYEGRDTDNRAISVLGIVVMAIMFVISVLIIPFSRYMWDRIGQEQAHQNAEKNSPAPSVAPEILVEVLPGGELAKFRRDAEANEANQKIDRAMQASLAKGFPARKS